MRRIFAMVLSTGLLLCGQVYEISEWGDTLIAGEMDSILIDSDSHAPLRRIMSEEDAPIKLGTPGEDVSIQGNRFGIGTLSPSAVLDVSSTESGVLIPRMTSVQRDAIPAPPEGSMIYNSDCGNFNYYNSGVWRAFPDVPITDIGSITGPTEVCAGVEGVTYSVGVYEGATYTWTLPAGAEIPSGDGSETVVVNFGSSSGTIHVNADGPCGESSSSLAVTVNPSTVGGVITAPDDTILLGAPTGSMILAGHTGSILRWQRNHDSGGWNDISWTSTSYTETPTAIGTYDYRALVRSGSCDSAFSTVATVEVIEHEGDTVEFIYTGALQTWTVPAGVTAVTIEAWGGQGGGSSYSGYSYTGGQGARMRGTFVVSPGDVLDIVVAGMGGSTSTYQAGGGGGSFVWTDGESLPMLIAGGGGGGGYASAIQDDGVTGSSAQNGQGDHSSYPFGLGGTAGNGGESGTGGCGGDTECSGGGAGWYSNGGGISDVGGKSRPTFAGGTGTVSGGFGGGGGGSSYGAGGGGGYSGGGGNGWQSSPYVHGAGGGGASYNSGTDQSNSAGVRSGNGLVRITY